MSDPGSGDGAPFHAHIYVAPGQAEAAEALQARLQRDPQVLFVGRITEGSAGPHPVPQFEAHFLGADVDRVSALIKATGLRALVHPLTDDDLADHTTHATWIGQPLDLDLTTLDPPGMNQGVPRFGKADF